MAAYDIGLLVVGVAVLGAVALPRLLEDRPLSFPILYVAAGALVFAIPAELPRPSPFAYPHFTERITELGVIVALQGAGLQIDRPPSWRRWHTTWRLLAITMPITIAATALLGWWAVGLTVPAAALLGAVIAPTDPVLASDVQVEPPKRGPSDEVRFSLTSEAGLNDGLAFPFTYLAVSMATLGVAPSNWFVEWATVDVLYRIAVGVSIGIVAGRSLAWFVFSSPAKTHLAQAMRGAEALAATLIAYGVTELLSGYGFIAVFVSAVALRDYERGHDYHEELHEFSEALERMLMAVLLVLFGGAISTGMLAPLTWEAMAVGIAVILVVRPLAGLVGLWGYPPERNAIAFFGIRGIGSFYYLAYGLNNAAFRGSDMLWALSGFIVLVSIIVHGITAPVVMDTLKQEIEERPNTD